MLSMSILFSLISSGLIESIKKLITHYGYVSIIGLMSLESASLPIPSEIVLPFAGLLISYKLLNFYAVLISALLGNLIGIMVDYYIGYYLGKEFVYGKIKLLKIKKESIDTFDKWFNEKGYFIVFISRMIPVVRGLASFPAGFSYMNKKKFLAYSMSGSLIYDLILIVFGMYALSTNDIYVSFLAIVVFIVIMYLIYKFFLRSINKKDKKSRKEE